MKSTGIPSKKYFFVLRIWYIVEPEKVRIEKCTRDGVTGESRLVSSHARCCHREGLDHRMTTSAVGIEYLRTGRNTNPVPVNDSSIARFQLMIPVANDVALEIHIYSAYKHCALIPVGLHWYFMHESIFCIQIRS